MRNSPGPSSRTAASTASPMQSSAMRTGDPKSSESLRATGASEYAGLGCPLGLPRCDMRITRAARSLR